ncbi:MAG TPA: class I tRNA ligase family protein, partial [Candidatus Polarisedimenticolia bacterium]|nr:class I tRNA ligase family protein [Candidatus Polarisedimenticolia bacterium]
EAVRAVTDGRVRFTPEHWVNSYYEWMEKIHDWCISRQLWWGHQIPAWHCGECRHITVAREEPWTCAACAAPGPRQDPDVLDTWFSSALWPFSTLGWPQKTSDLERYYPTSTLVTGFDILFFWVARMLMMGLHLMGDVPFRQVYITGLVRDAEGQKMSKTRGNVVDPLELVERHGADAVRFTMAAMATPGSDLPLSEERMAGYRAFANKLWNAARFVLINRGGAPGESVLPPLPSSERLALPDRWILSRLTRLADEVEVSLSQFRFDEMANALYRFVWHEYCDWYLEMAKPALTSAAPPGDAARTRAVLLHVLERVLRLLHPVMPFLTEEIWQRLPHEGETIARATYPAADHALLDDDAEDRVSLLMELVTRVRNIRAELNLDPGRRLRLLYRPADAATERTISENLATLIALARLESAERSDSLESAGPVARAVAAGCDLAVPLAGILDLQAELRRFTREIERLDREKEGHARKLKNPDFMSKADPAVIDKTRRIHQELQEKLDRLARTVESLRWEGSGSRT